MGLEVLGFWGSDGQKATPVNREGATREGCSYCQWLKWCAEIRRTPTVESAISKCIHE
jgi:hypothetical protein